MLMAGSYCNVRCTAWVHCRLPYPQRFSCSDHCAITVTLNFDQLPMTHSKDWQKAKHINWKFEDVDWNVGSIRGLILCKMQHLHGGLLRPNRGKDAYKLNDLLAFMSNAMLQSGKQIFGMRKPAKFNVPGWNEQAKKLNARYREAVCPEVIHLKSWNAGHELLFGMNLNFWERMEINSVVSQCYQIFEGENAIISERKLKHSFLRRNPCH